MNHGEAVSFFWVLANRKAKERRGKVLFVDGTSFWTPMRKSLGDKRSEVPQARADRILALLREFKDAEHARIFPTTHFGYRKITVEQPRRRRASGSRPLPSRPSSPPSLSGTRPP